MICVGLVLAGQVANSSTVKRDPFDLGPTSENSDKLLFSASLVQPMGFVRNYRSWTLGQVFLNFLLYW